MGETSDIIIIGGGVIGLSLGWRLVEDGARVMVFDARARAPAATNAAAGMLAPSFERAGGALDDALYELSVAGLDKWRDFAPALEAASGMAVDYRPEGVLGVAFHEEEIHALRADYEALRARGGDGRWLEGAGLHEFEPGLAANVKAGFFAAQDGQVDPPKVLAALRLAFVKAGGIFMDDAPVVAIKEMNGAVAGVETADGREFSAPQIVIASGAFYGQSFAGGFSGPALPVFPVKGEALCVAAEGASLKCTLRAPGVYICPKADGRIVIGATEIDHETSLDVSPAAIADLKSRAIEAAPALASAEIIDQWAGLRPGVRDGAPILGPAALGPAALGPAALGPAAPAPAPAIPAPDGLVFALGHYRNGVLLAPITAEILTDYLRRNKRPPLLEAFSANRFYP